MMKNRMAAALALGAVLCACATQETPKPQPPRPRNHEGRELPPTPPVARPIPFNTPEADAVLSSLQIFPKDNPWNEDISQRPVHPDSARIIETIGRDLRFRWNQDMSFILVPPDQPKLPVAIGAKEESDPGPYPIPDQAPLEGWPLSKVPLEMLQREGDGDRHLIVVDPAAMKLYELFATYRRPAGWKCDSAAIFDLRSNALRPDGWTSADAGGLPIFPAIVRYDECERGMVEHALRVTFRRTRRAYVYPATHYASALKDPLLPRMGDRFRLRADFDLSRFPPHVQAILKGLKKYGMIVADNGIDWAVSTAPDSRIQGLETLDHKALKGSDFELVVTTGPDEGPRRPEPEVKDEKYGPHERNVLDLWKAPSPLPTPLVVFIHGGGFLEGSKGYAKADLINRCREQGLSVAAINYRYSSQAPFPAPFQDAARAVQYLRSRAKDWNLDPAHFGATGGSAGGGISLWLAFHDDLADPRSEDPVARRSSRLQAVVGIVAQCSYDPRWIREHIGGRAHEHAAIAKLYGLPPSEADSERAHALYEEAAAIRHLTKDDPPAYLWYDGKDQPGPRAGAGIHSARFGEILKAEMDKLGISCELKIGEDTIESQVAFLAKRLKASPR
ncbi:MAG: alpha/beta hydrolase [Planctomycetes bacterium]|nr:alpha/beta hydrolase [Planctomycetota bacterium]